MGDFHDGTLTLQHKKIILYIYIYWGVGECVRDLIISD